MLPVCTGSDTGGSLRIPAAKCGVVGFRPSPGLVPVERRPFGWAPISVVGPMGRSIEDTCLLLAAQAAMDACDPLSYPVDPLSFRQPEPCDPGSLRVAWTEDFGVCAVDPGIRSTMRARIEAIRPLFRRCDPVTFDFGEAHRCFDIIRAVSYVGRYHDAYVNDRASLGPNVRANYEMGASMSLADFAWAHMEQTRICRAFQEIYRDYDLVLAPTTPVSPFPWTQLYSDEIDGQRLANYYQWLALTYVITLVANPAVSMPCGVDHRGMPFGLQVVGCFRGDKALLNAAHAMEREFATRPELMRPRPDIEALRTPMPELTSIVTHPPRASAH